MYWQQEYLELHSHFRMMYLSSQFWRILFYPQTNYLQMLLFAMESVLPLGQVLKYNGERCIPYHQQIVENDVAYIKDDTIMICMAGISVCKYVLNAYNTMSEANKVDS